MSLFSCLFLFLAILYIVVVFCGSCLALTLRYWGKSVVASSSVSSLTAKCSLDGRQRFYLECVDVQADPSLRWAYILCRKCCALAQIIIKKLHIS